MSDFAVRSHGCELTNRSADARNLQQAIVIETTVAMGRRIPPIREVPEEIETPTLDQIEVKSYVGGLVKSFERKVA